MMEYPVACLLPTTQVLVGEPSLAPVLAVTEAIVMLVEARPLEDAAPQPLEIEPLEHTPETWGDTPSFAAAMDAWASSWLPRLPAPTTKACLPLEPDGNDTVKRSYQQQLVRCHFP